MELYTYFRSSAAYRVRIALHLKNLSAHQHFVHLLNNGGEQFSTAYDALNPQHLVPTFTDGDTVLTQSLAIMEYLDEQFPTVPLLPSDAAARAQVRALSLAIACDIHPLNNLRVLKYLSEQFGISAEQKEAWYRHWVAQGLSAVERQLVTLGSNGRYCIGATPTMADCCLIPQLYNARRFGCDLSAYPTATSIEAHCTALPAFALAAPEQQADAG